MKRIIVVLSVAGLGVYTACTSICDDISNANQTILDKVNQCTEVQGNYAVGPITGYDAGVSTPDLGPGQVCFYVPACTADMANCSSADQAILEKQVACANTFSSGACSSILYDGGSYFAPSLTSCIAAAGSLSQACRQALGNNPFFMSLASASAASIGTPQSVTVTVLDYCGNPVPYYSGTVSFSSNDTAASLPAAYKFIPAGPDGGGGDQGVQTFQVTFMTSSNLLAAGVTNITAFDVSEPSVQGTTPINITCTADTQCPSGQVCDCAGTHFCGAPATPGAPGTCCAMDSDCAGDAGNVCCQSANFCGPPTSDGGGSSC
jgi:hypothetical protein